MRLELSWVGSMVAAPTGVSLTSIQLPNCAAAAVGVPVQALPSLVFQPPLNVAVTAALFASPVKK